MKTLVRTWRRSLFKLVITHSVRNEDLTGTMDETLYDVICREQRCLITFDLDFCNVLRYPTATTSGIIVVRPHRPLSRLIVRGYAEKIAHLLKIHNPTGCLWVLEPGRLRIRKPRQ